MIWSHYVSTSNNNATLTPKLPVWNNFSLYCYFLESFQKVLKGKGISCLIHDQYDVPSMFKTLNSFTRTLNTIRDSVESWLKDTLFPIIEKENIDTFKECIAALSDFIKSSANWNSSESIDFFSQHVLMNINEVISDFPVGEPNEVTFGFGSDFGIRVLKNSNPSKRQEYLVEWLKLMERSSDRMLSLLGYQRDQDTNNVVVKANGRRMTTLDSEHYFCVAGYILPQRKSGGTRGFSSNPRLSRKHLYPIKKANFFLDCRSCKIAAEAISCYEDSIIHDKLNFLDSEIKYRRPVECQTFVIIMAMVNGWNGGSLDDLLSKHRWIKEPLNQRMLRDNYRCLSTEIHSGHCVITIDQNSNELYNQSNKERHFQYNIENISQSRSRIGEKSFIDSVKYMWGKVVEIDLDYCWFQNNYYTFSNNFYANCIPEMSLLLEDGGSINFPLNADIFVGIIDNQESIGKIFDIQLVGERDCNKIHLFAATESIQDENIWDMFGKIPKQYEHLQLRQSQLQKHYHSRKQAEQTWSIFQELSRSLLGKPRFIKLKKKPGDRM